MASLTEPYYCSSCQKIRNVQQAKSFYRRDPMVHLRRYVALKYLQYSVLSSVNNISFLIGSVGSLYSSFVLLMPSVSKKSTTEFVSCLVRADITVFLKLILQAVHLQYDITILSDSFVNGLLQNLLTVNVHVSSLMLGCISIDAFLITLFPEQSRHIRTVRYAKLTTKLVWIIVIAECFIFQTEFIQESDLSGIELHSYLSVLHFCQSLAPDVHSLSYFVGFFLKMLHVYIYYKILLESPFSELKGGSKSIFAELGQDLYQIKMGVLESREGLNKCHNVCFIVESVLPTSNAVERSSQENEVTLIGESVVALDSFNSNVEGNMTAACLIDIVPPVSKGPQDRSEAACTSNEGFLGTKKFQLQLPIQVQPRIRGKSQQRGTQKNVVREISGRDRRCTPGEILTLLSGGTCTEEPQLYKKDVKHFKIYFSSHFDELVQPPFLDIIHGSMASNFT
ncbi:uncharacterized protein LOC122789841 [Protopterus annectens]|uniref:uncharacterized protein LOC122789841 n=1 Tax=Protopterus annectens TaxID=7888 RepID=UPI001CFAE357|nr:uncharacterized protein LOC122789841 [Protopterus annectens]